MAKALYIHWPFCEKKCPYCDFNSHVRDQIDYEDWREVLIADLRWESRTAKPEKLQSIFFGGGTPSLMPPSLVYSLVNEAEKLWGFEPGIEITLEANPSSVEVANFLDLASVGINRISLGVQSFMDHHLKFLGRVHSSLEAKTALDIAQRNFERVSIDLIYALPDQTPENWFNELTQAVSNGTEHLSLYQLTIEQNTRFATDVRRGLFQPMEEDLATELYTMTDEIMTQAGLPAYEISNHSRPGCASAHNLAYWRYNDYHGVGPGAHGRIANYALQRHKKPENFVSAVRKYSNGLKERKRLKPREMVCEALLMGLRLTEGLDLKSLEGRMGFSQKEIVNEAKIKFLEGLGLVSLNQSTLSVTNKGRPVLDGIIAEVVNDGLHLT
jgi:putative oxygen-independent coproporphyrinogen III oxidase